MKNTNRQILPFGRSTKAEKAGLSLLRPKLFTVVGDTYKYFNAIFQKNISKPISKVISPFIARLKSKKFPAAKDMMILLSCTGHQLRLTFKNPFRIKFTEDRYGFRSERTYWIPYKA